MESVHGAQSPGHIKEGSCWSRLRVLIGVLWRCVVTIGFLLKQVLAKGLMRMQEPTAQQVTVQAPATETTAAEDAEPTQAETPTSPSIVPLQRLSASQITECRDFNLRSQCQEQDCRQTEEFVRSKLSLETSFSPNSSSFCSSFNAPL